METRHDTRARDAAFAEVILPLQGGVYTYAVPGELVPLVGEGSLVVVPLGRSKRYTGVVKRLTGERPQYKNIREVLSVHRNFPPVGRTMLALWAWVAEYYMCGEGDAMRVAIPAALKPAGFSDVELDVRAYRPAQQVDIALGDALDGMDGLNEAFEKLRRRGPKMYEALVGIVAAVGEADPFTASVPWGSLGIDPVVIGRLEKKGLVRRLTTDVPSGGQVVPKPVAENLLPTLSKVQAEAVSRIDAAFESTATVLLHGVTGSGKTEIYIRLIARQLAAGKDVLYLLPEIAMTAQTVARLRRFFGDRVIPYHSSYPVRRKTENFIRASSSSGGTLIVGARSAVFLPGEKLGLVIVDEEHDPSYKNHESAPRYNARDTAVVLAGMSGAKTLLGSATPSLESYSNAMAGKYGYVYVGERFGGTPMPDIVVSDTIAASKRGERKSHFNKLTLDNLSDALAHGRQAMLFQNRRGFSPFVECTRCGWTASCPNCNVTLTYHKSEASLRCHYCGYGQGMPAACPGCGQKAVEPRGFGTEKVEEELAALFPGAVIERLDRDTATSEKRFSAIIRSFEEGRTDILVGTQMITKGFDFGGVCLVAVLNADNLLAYPDFRASERAFQLLTQVAGRAGRRDRQGRVIIQTGQPQHPVIVQAVSGDYAAMARSQLAERREFLYPPYCRIVNVHLRHADRNAVQQAAGELAGELRTVFGKRVCGPQPPPVDKVGGLYLERIMLKVERESSFGKVKAILRDRITALGRHPVHRKVTVYCDVDPI